MEAQGLLPRTALTGPRVSGLSLSSHLSPPLSLSLSHPLSSLFAILNLCCRYCWLVQKPSAAWRLLTLTMYARQFTVTNTFLFAPTSAGPGGGRPSSAARPTTSARSLAAGSGGGGTGSGSVQSTPSRAKAVVSTSQSTTASRTGHDTLAVGGKRAQNTPWLDQSYPTDEGRRIGQHRSGLLLTWLSFYSSSRFSITSFVFHSIHKYLKIHNTINSLSISLYYFLIFIDLHHHLFLLSLHSVLLPMPSSPHLHPFPLIHLAISISLYLGIPLCSYLYSLICFLSFFNSKPSTEQYDAQSIGVPPRTASDRNQGRPPLYVSFFQTRQE